MRDLPKTPCWPGRKPLFALVGLYLRYFGLELALELVACALELAQRFTQLAAHLRQLLRPKKQQGEQKDKDHFGHSEIHGCMILRPTSGSNEWLRVFRHCGEKFIDLSEPVEKLLASESLATCGHVAPVRWRSLYVLYF